MDNPTSNNTLSAEYIAGFFDGEGCITMRRANRYKIGNHQYAPTYTVVVLFTNRSLEALKELQSDLGGTIYPKARKSAEHCAAYELCLFKKVDVQNFLDKIGPCVRLKAPQIALAQGFLQLPKTKRLYIGRGKTWPIFRACPQETAVKEGYKIRLTELNKRGPLTCQQSLNLSSVSSL